MANIASPNIIKASDINDLTINTLTTSGDITCNGNLSVPNGNVTANMYYGKGGVFENSPNMGICTRIYDDLNSLNSSGMFMGAGLLNCPITGWVYIISFVHNDTYHAQIVIPFFPSESSNIYIRRSVYDTDGTYWYPWKKITPSD